MLNSELVGSSDGDNVMSFVSSQPHHPSLHQAQDVDLLSRNSTALFSNETAGVVTAHMSDPAGSQANRTLSSTDSAQLSTDSNFEACPPHLDLPIPGIDIAPANESKCYTHPAKYINTNYLNDSFYMLYHHDKLPTSEPHPAFTWGDISRFSHAMHKMKRNDPVKAIFVGGSVSSSYCR